MKLVKRILEFVCIYFTFLCTICTTVIAANTELKIGDYVTVGKYNGSPVVWRYSVNDDNGMLMVSKDILCEKRYSSPRKDENYYRSDWTSANYWSVSTIRAWLNSDEDEGKVAWLDNNPPLSYKGAIISDSITNGYADEAGFLNNNNFSEKEKKLFKDVTQWTMLPAEHLELSENGLKNQYSYIKETKVGAGTAHDNEKFIYINYTIPELPNAYYGAAMQTTDKVFLLDEIQLYNIWKNFGDVTSPAAENIVINDGKSEKNGYTLRNGFTGWSGAYYGYKGECENGIRPAFYLNTDAIETMTGSGTLNDPYILNAGSNGNITTPSETDNITVTVDNTPLTFDVEPIIENDRVLVPMRKIFETLGANVEWNGNTQTVTATKDEIKINLQIGNTEMQVNGKAVTLDAAPKLLNDRTLVPVRAVSESLNANVDWNEKTRKVTVTTVK